MARRGIYALGLFCFIAGLMFGQAPRTFDVRTFGAAGDGKAIDTGAINKAIDAAAAAGGGTVYFPAGVYASYSIRLKSNVALYLEQGATILAANPPAVGEAGGYDPPEPNAWDKYEDFGHAHWHNSLIWGEGLQNIAILGPGTIFGRGLSRGFGRKDPLPSEGPSKHRDKREVTPGVTGKIGPGPFGYPNAHDTLPAGVGNKAIALKNCRNVILRDFTIFHGGHFGILAIATDNFTIDNLKIDTNRDGIDVDCCANVRISNCTVNSPFDDGICLKSCFGLGYLRATENVTITNCQVSGYVEGSLLDGTYKKSLTDPNETPTGRIKLGTEANGGFKNITVSNCVFDYCRGLALEEVDGGPMEDITITNLTMRDIVNAPIFVRLGLRNRGPDNPRSGAARRIKISNVIASNVAPDHGILILGLADHPVEDLSLSNILIEYRGGGTEKQALRSVPEFEEPENGDRYYPEPRRFGVIPSYGLFARHVKNFSADRIELRYLAEDHRPAVILDDIAGVDLDHLKAEHSAGAPILVLKKVNGFTIHHSPGVPETERDQIEEAQF